MISRVKHCIFFVLIAITFIACNKQSTSVSRQTIKFWHFWSEPHQKAVLQEQIAEFERLNPSIHVELTDLQWSDGKTKLMLGFNAHTAPDVVHLGFEWMPEFINSGVLAPLSDSLTHDTTEYFSPALQALVDHQKLYALPWTMNTRAMLISKSIFPNSQSYREQGKLFYGQMTWDSLRALKKSGKISNFWGINTAEPHNVLKKTLPVIWSAGSNLFTSTPLSKTFDTASIKGLEFYIEMCEGGIIDQSRKLDDLFLQRKVATWITGQWILDKSKEINRDSSFIVMEQMPKADYLITGYSILGGDCLAVSSQANQQKASEMLVRFLTKFEQSGRFCTKISDAGFPASKKVFTYEFNEKLDKNQRGFLGQVQYSRPLPSSPIFLDAERILEEEVMNAVYKKKTAREALASAQKRIEELELKVRK